MLRITAITSTIALLSAPAMANGYADVMGYALSGDGSTLTVMDSLAAPSEARSVTLSMPVRSIAYRPVTGDLVGYADGAIVTIDPQTGATMDQGATFMDDAMIDAGAAVAFDFNNQIDAVRAVSSDGDNLVYFPSDFGDERANSVRRFTDAFYAEGDMFDGTAPQIFANAYTNAIDGANASSTFQYALDARTDALVSLANNAGTLETVGRIMVDGAPVDLLPAGGFEIVTPSEGADSAYAILQIAGLDGAGLYQIDLSSGAAMMLADLGSAEFSGFAAAKRQ